MAKNTLEIYTLVEEMITGVEVKEND